MTDRPSGLFYGWWNVATGFVGMGLSYAMFTIFAFGVFVRPLEEEFGWSRGELSLAITMTNFAVVLASPCLGFIIDRFGVRRVLIPSVIMMGLTVASMALLSANLWHFYALYFLIPFLGAGTLPQSYSRVLIAWFERRRGIALGISLAGFGVGAMLVPVVAQLMIENYGWRMAYIGFAAAVFVLALPMALFVMKETPEEMGSAPDGGPARNTGDGNSVSSVSPRLQHAEPAPGLQHAGAGPAVVSRGAVSVADNDNGGNKSAVPASGLSCPQAARTRSFWLILFSFMLVGIGITSIIAHLVPMLTDRGVAPAVAALCMSSLALGLIAGRLLSGFLMDYFFAPYVAAFFLLGLLGGIIILATGTAGALVFVAAVCVGMATGSEISEIAYICSRYFGPRAFGLIYGLMFAAFQLGSMVGSPLMGLYYDRAGDYIGALWVVAAIVLVGTVLIVLLGPYPDKFKGSEQML
ncbi:MAG: MFS transporter [Gammaproteobacteria bacterium]|nr:MFS transporter [Gammaproteobacteria bacterium]